MKHLPSLIRHFLVSSLRLLGAGEAIAVQPQAVALFTEGVAAARVVAQDITPVPLVQVLALLFKQALILSMFSMFITIQLQ
jgi:hypothetical protein